MPLFILLVTMFKQQEVSEEDKFASIIIHGLSELRQLTYINLTLGKSLVNIRHFFKKKHLDCDILKHTQKQRL